jgi:hypothetical protein
VWDAMRAHWHLGIAMEDPNVDALSCPPPTKALRYQRLKAYGNHFWVNDCKLIGTISFDCEVVWFLANGKHTWEMSMHQ